MRDQQTWLIHSCPVSPLVWCHCYSHWCGCIRMDPGMFRRGWILYPDSSSTIQTPPYVFLLMEIECWHLDLSSNERRMVVSQDHPQDLWRRIPFLGVKKVRLMLHRSSRNPPSCFGLIMFEHDNNLPEAEGSFHFCWCYSGLSSEHNYNSKHGFLPC